MMTQNVVIAGLAAVGAMVAAWGLTGLRHRALTARRVAALIAEESQRTQGVARPRLEWHAEARQVLAQIDARGTFLREPLIAAACVCVLIGLASVSAAWFGMAVLSGMAAHALGGRARRRRRIEAQALDAMALLASGLRAGYSVPQAIGLVSKHSPQPTASEFSLAAQEISVGMHLADALARMARRTANADYELVAIIVRVHHEVGGNLAQILDSVSETLRERFELRRQVNALTAQQRLSSIVLTILPFALVTFLFVMDRSFVEPLFNQTVGRLVLALAGVMVFVGWTVMRSLGRVEV
jgi:tight adherence protein B